MAVNDPISSATDEERMTVKERAAKFMQTSTTNSSQRASNQQKPGKLNAESIKFESKLKKDAEMMKQDTAKEGIQTNVKSLAASLSTIKDQHVLRSSSSSPRSGTLKADKIKERLHRSGRSPLRSPTRVSINRDAPVDVFLTEAEASNCDYKASEKGVEVTTPVVLETSGEITQPQADVKSCDIPLDVTNTIEIIAEANKEGDVAADKNAALALMESLPVENVASDCEAIDQEGTNEGAIDGGENDDEEIACSDGLSADKTEVKPHAVEGAPLDETSYQEYAGQGFAGAEDPADFKSHVSLDSQEYENEEVHEV